jgi:hypothetical protein
MTPRLLLTSLLAACLTSAALGQTSGQSGLDRAIIGANTQLTEAQKNAVSSFAAKHLAAIKDGTSSATGKGLEDARWALVTPARDPAATPAFRKAYAGLLIVELVPVVKGPDLRRALNAMQILRFTRSPDAIDVIIERTAPGAEADAGKRIAAASLLADAFEDLDASNTFYESSSRRLRDASAAESDWMALQQKLNAIAAAARRKDLPAENARNVRRAQAEAIGLVAKSAKASTEADNRMLAMQRILVGLRNDLLVMPQADRSFVAKSLAPALTDLVAATSSQWQAAHADANMNASYASVVGTSEVILRLIDRGERPQAYTGSKPDADSRVLAASWESGDKAKFDAELKRWSAVVSAAPYKN